MSALQLTGNTHTQQHTLTYTDSETVQIASILHDTHIVRELSREHKGTHYIPYDRPETRGRQCAPPLYLYSTRTEFTIHVQMK